MKIYLLANMYPSEAYPSYGVFVKNTEGILQDAGFTVTKTVMTKTTNKFGKLFKYLIYYLTILLRGLFGQYDYIYVHYASHNAMPLLLLKKLKPSVRIVTNVHGSDVVPEVESQNKYQPYVKRLLEQSTKIITPSNYYKELVKEKYGVSTPIYVFPSGGVNKEVFYPAPDKVTSFKEDLRLDVHSKYIGFVGRLDVGKGWDLFLDAIHHLKQEKPSLVSEYSFIVVGSGKEEGDFKQKVQDLDLSDQIVHFPLMKQQDLTKVFNLIDLFCFPTTRKGESLGLVGLEAMACGTPIVASRIGGILDYVKDGTNSFLFDVGDAKQLANKISYFHSLDQTEKDRVSHEALATALEYEVSNIQHILVDIFYKSDTFTQDNNQKERELR